MNKRHNQVLDELCARLAQEPADADTLPDWLGLAGRAAVIGDRSYVDKRAPELLRRFGLVDNLKTLVLDRARKGAWDLKHAKDETQGYAVIDVQDWVFLERLEPPPSWLTPSARDIIRGWEACADEMALDVEALEMVEAYQQRYGFPEDLLLPVVAAPLSRPEVVFLTQLADALRSSRGTVPVDTTIEPILAMAAGQRRSPESLRWLSPEMSFSAEADLLYDQDRVVLSIRHLDGTSVSQFHGLKGSLASVAFTLDEHGSANLRPDDLQAFPQRVRLNPTLIIGLRQWRTVENPK